MADAVVLKTKKVFNNKLLQRRQMIVEVHHGNKSAVSRKEIKAKLHAAGVISDVLDDFDPTNAISVTFNGGKTISYGNELTPTDVFDGVVAASWQTEPGALYTLVKTDPDAPAREEPKWREWGHWILGNIPGHDLSKGTPVWDYVGCGPPKGTGLHRYVYVLYKQAGQVDFSKAGQKSKHQANGRGGFKIRDFAKEYHLGSPIAANWFQAQWDETVPKVYALFKE